MDTKKGSGQGHILPRGRAAKVHWPAFAAGRRSSSQGRRPGAERTSPRRPGGGPPRSSAGATVHKQTLKSNNHGETRGTAFFRDRDRPLLLQPPSQPGLSAAPPASPAANRQAQSVALPKTERRPSAAAQHPVDLCAVNALNNAGNTGSPTFHNELWTVSRRVGAPPRTCLTIPRAFLRSRSYFSSDSSPDPSDVPTSCGPRWPPRGAPRPTRPSFAPSFQV